MREKAPDLLPENDLAETPFAKVRKLHPVHLHRIFTACSCCR